MSVQSTSHRAPEILNRHQRLPSGCEIVSGIRDRSLRAREVLETYLSVIEADEANVQAWAFLDLQAARTRADAVDAMSDAQREAATLLGVPVGFKDNIDTAEMPTGYGSPIYDGYRPGRDAACVASMRLAGCNPLGKTVSAEFAHRHPGPTCNPWNLAHTPGGSSSGSAAAVAAGMVPLALGSQTTGSTIRPAAYCGVIGYKPTYGEFNLAGTLANTPSFDTLGVFARSVDDIALARRALLDPTIPAVTPKPLHGTRVGICRTPWWSQACSQTQALIESSAEALEREGAVLFDFDATFDFTDLEQANIVVSGYEFARTLAHERRVAYEALSPILRDGRMADGLVHNYADYVRALRTIAQSRIRFDAAMNEVDFLITPAAPSSAPKSIGSTGTAVFNMLWTVLYAPAMTVPIANSDNGLPLGLQLVGAAHSDDKLLAYGHTVLTALAA